MIVKQFEGPVRVVGVDHALIIESVALATKASDDLVVICDNDSGDYFRRFCTALGAALGAALGGAIAG